MTAKKLFLFCMFLVCEFIFAQHDTISLREVLVSDAQLKNFSNTQSVTVLNDSVIAKNAASLTTLLNYNSTLYFKENGLGMVSSPSFRGTTAQQTAVIWNGININSQLNGLTDFNTIPVSGFDNVTVRGGGGSSIYGSSAIGGSIHLNNELEFGNGFSNALHLNFGSFNTFSAAYNLKASNTNTSVQAGLSRNSSENDYQYLGTSDKRNENGQFYNTSVNAAFGYRINSHHYLKLYSQLFEGERHFSGTLAARSKSKYRDVNTRNLIEWFATSGKWTSRTRTAFLSEQYQYFENAKTQNFESAKAETFIAKYDLNYILHPKVTANFVIDYTQTKGFGEQIGKKNRSVGAVTFLMKHQITRRIGYEIHVKKEVTDNYESPILSSIGTYFHASKNYTVLFNASKNFRIPTFNDLYWQGLGNSDLNPESSYQLEVGQQFRYRKWFLSATAFYMDIRDMIQWNPDDTDGNFRPDNIAAVSSYGAELLLTYEKKIGNHRANIRSNYAYVISEDGETHRQLIYVPMHKANVNLAYYYQKFSFDYQFLFNGYVFTPSKKYNIVSEYFVSNVGIGYDLGNKYTCKIGVRVLNLWNEVYQSVLQRPMPGRNYSMCLTLKM